MLGSDGWVRVGRYPSGIRRGNWWHTWSSKRQGSCDSPARGKYDPLPLHRRWQGKRVGFSADHGRLASCDGDAQHGLGNDRAFHRWAKPRHRALHANAACQFNALCRRLPRKSALDSAQGGDRRDPGFQGGAACRDSVRAVYQGCGHHGFAALRRQPGGADRDARNDPRAAQSQRRDRNALCRL